MSRRAALRAAALALAIALLALPAAARAQAADEPKTIVTAQRGDLRAVPPGDERPPGKRLRPSEAIAIALGLGVVREARAERSGSYARAYLKGVADWQVSVYAVPRTPGERSVEIAQVRIRDRDGRVLEAWTGPQVAWTMARGYEGAFGRSANAPYIWLPLCLLFLAPFLRRPLRWLHVDLAVLLAFGLSYLALNHARVDWSVPSAALLLAYLLVRSLALARRPSGAAAPLRLPAADVLAFGLVFLLGFRVALNLTDGNVIDVGYAGVIGGDRILSGEQLYGAFPRDNRHGDTYGPVMYLLYAPFVALFGWSGSWDDLPAAHGAAVAFDLAAVALLYLLGRRVRGHVLGLLVAYLWAAYPFTLLVSNSGANDAAVAALVALALLAAGRPVARGATLALAALAKFAPLALAPLLLLRGGGRLRASAAFAAVLAALLAFVAVSDGLQVFWRSTLGFQGERDSPFSPWGLYDLDAAQVVAQAAAAGLIAAVAVVPRRRLEAPALCALAAATLIAAQLVVDHWFYLYLVWFLPPLLVALVAPLVSAPAAAPARSRPPAAVASSG